MTTKIHPSPESEPIIVMSRTFDAPRDVVWAAFTDPKHVARWYGGHGFENPVCEMDVRPGGLWRHVMRTPEGHEFAATFVFVEVVRPSVLVWQDEGYGKAAAGGHGADDRKPTARMTVTLEEVGRQTKWQLIAQFSSVADRDAAQKMGFVTVLAQGVEKFDELVKALRVS